MTTTSRPALMFDVHGSTDRLTVASFDLVVAGYTGRDEGSVQRHIEELAAIGIAPPQSVPTFYELDSDLVTQADAVDVTGTNTSGEVEPVIVRSRGKVYVTVGSDHTDRTIERTSVLDSKAACPKPVGRTVIPVPDDLDWDTIRGQCSVDGAIYQDGTLDALLRPTDVLRMYDDRAGNHHDLVLFGGTLPLIDGAFVAGSDWAMSMTWPAGLVLDLTYSITVTPR